VKRKPCNNLDFLGHSPNTAKPETPVKAFFGDALWLIVNTTDQTVTNNRGHFSTHLRQVCCPLRIRILFHPMLLSQESKMLASLLSQSPHLMRYSGIDSDSFKRGAIFLDFVNLHASIHNTLNPVQRYDEYCGRHPQLFSPHMLMQHVETRYGGIVLAKAYSNWNFFVKYLEEVRNAGIEPVFTNDRYAKNTDRVMTADAVEAACTVPGLDFVVLGTGDGDFVPLAQKLRMRKLKVYAVGVRGSISDELRAACDHTVTILPSGTWPEEMPKVSNKPWQSFPSRNGHIVPLNQ
jgi:uncharacterized protein (TIGR00288 family)